MNTVSDQCNSLSVSFIIINGDAEEYRIGQYSKESLRKSAFGGYKENHVLTDKGKNKSKEELQRQIRQRSFCVEQKRCLKHYPSAPNDISGLFAIFEGRGINTCGSVRYKYEYQFYNRSDHTQ